MFDRKKYVNVVDSDPFCIVTYFEISKTSVYKSK